MAEPTPVQLESTTETIEPSVKRIMVVSDLLHIFNREVNAGVRSFSQTLEPTSHWFVLMRLLGQRPLKEMIEIDRPDGVIAQIFEADNARQIEASGVPWVNIGGRVEGIDAPLVETDDVAVGKMAAEEFIHRGLQNFGFVGMNASNSDVREKGYRDRLAQADLACESYHLREPVAWHESSEELMGQVERLMAWLEERPLPIGIFAMNDDYAAIVNEACYKQKLKIPEQVKLMGVDNDELYCESVHPTLSSIQIDAEHIGYTAAEMLSRLMEGETTVPRHVSVKPIGLVPRMSTEMLATSDHDITRALNFIRENACKHITVDHVATHVSISRRMLEIKFKQALRQTPANEIRRVKVDRAMNLLRNSDLPIYRVAERSGFRDSASLARLFRSIVGETPADYRQRCKRHGAE